ncbi:MAG TPA: PepSY-associated TM helix domain-containing protein [Chitinophaga sp.]|uniref:PepSY-associated TM helix domain-containing protein n=1 Tax=Chitinophaga sp. TaxID=1869181 RepID=UPI002B8A02E7|nr:PepSY-associated TM helix domain-containing protein [Chitinophaga sp.]HVI45943.1 PepSY-associated TM helix domain-containing protein [Chitinophaga sp.]
MKVFFRRIHLYLGLAAGLVITVSCLTGALLVFEKELTEAFNRDRYFVQQMGRRLTLDEIAANVKQQVPGANITRIQVFSDPSRTMAVGLEEGKKGGKKKEDHEGESKDRKEKNAAGAKPSPRKEKGRTAFVNPYTGKVIALFSYQETFYYKIFSLHRRLLAGSTGKVIVGISTFIFLFILITGIVLWWPKTRNIFKQRIKVKWDGGWKRLNHDMHIVLGFYASIFLFVSAFTGLTWSFEWFSKGMYAALRTSPKATEAPASAAEAAPGTAAISYEGALALVKQQAPDAIYYSLSAPKDSTASFMVTLLPAGITHEGATTSYYLDQFTGKVLLSQTFAQKNLGQQIRSTIKPLHTGAIFGTPSKIFALVLALLGATFPVTGTILWINRTRKKTKSARNRQSLSPAVATA